jgi:glycine cleavage system regulatory protein
MANPNGVTEEVCRQIQDQAESESLTTPLHGSVWHKKDRKRLTLTFSTEDRTGLVNRIAELAAAHEIHIVRNHGTRVDDVAASTFIFEGDEDDLRRFEHAFKKIKAVEGDVLLLPVKQIDVHFVGEDRPGLLRDVTKVFAVRGINMVQLDGFVHVETKRDQSIRWAVFFIRVELLKRHLTQIEEVKSELEKVGVFLAVSDHVFKDFGDDGHPDDFTPEQHQTGNQEVGERGRFFASLVNTVVQN